MLLLCGALRAQELSLTFTSVTDAKFFVYLNGRLQNETSKGMVTLRGLEEKDYHIRIVIDDPYAVQLTRTLRPGGKHSEYDVLFNAVRERIYLRPSKTEASTELWSTSEDRGSAVEAPAPAKSVTPRPALRRTNQQDSVTQRILNRVRPQATEQ